jgi:hypothetical protein
VVAPAGPKASWHPHTRPRQRVHTLRSFPLAGSRVASRRPLPPRRSPRHSALRPVSRPTPACHAPTRMAQHAYVPSPPGCRLASAPKSEATRHGPSTDWHRPHMVTDASSTAPHSDLPRPTAAFHSHGPQTPLSVAAFGVDFPVLLRPRGTGGSAAVTPRTGAPRGGRDLASVRRVSPMAGRRAHTARRGHRCASASLKASRRTSTALGNRLLDCWKAVSHPCKRKEPTVVVPSSPDPGRRSLSFVHTTDRGRWTAPQCGVPQPTSEEVSSVGEARPQAFCFRSALHSTASLPFPHSARE